MIRAVLSEAAHIVRLAWPVVLGQIGLVAMGVVDLLMIGPLGSTATAGVGIGNALSAGTLFLVMGVAAGLDPLVTQAWGAGDPGRAGTAAARGAVVALLVCLPVIGMHLASEPILTLLQQPPDVRAGAATYCQIMSLGVIPFGLFTVLQHFLQGGGAMRPAMWVIGIGNILNLIGDWALVQHFDLGIAGVAWCTVGVRWLMLGALWYLSRATIQQAKPTTPILSFREIAAVAWVTIPVSIQLGLEAGAFNVCAFMAGALGPVPAAAHTAAMSAALVAFMIPIGLGAAAATRVGNLVGAGEDWRRSGATAIALGVCVMAVSAVIFLVVPHRVGMLYSQDGEVVVLMATILPVAAVFGWFDATQEVSFGVLRGLGDVQIPTLFNLLGYWGIGLPVGASLAFGGGYGLPGVWLGLTLGLGVVATLILARLARHSRTMSSNPVGAP